MKLLSPCLICALAFSAYVCFARQAQGNHALSTKKGEIQVALHLSRIIIAGNRPNIWVSGLKNGERIRVHMLRREKKGTYNPATGYRENEVILHSWVELMATNAGRAQVDSSTPLAGTYRQADPLGLLWSGYEVGNPRLKEVATPKIEDMSDVQSGLIAVRVTRGNEIVAQGEFRLDEALPGTNIEDVKTEGLTAVFAAPPGAKKLPTLIVLHGSEGGSKGFARSRASYYSAQGFAVLVISYFANPEDGLPGLPVAHTNVPIELLQLGRDWLAKRPEADADRIALVGSSKGAEFAEVGAVRYSWVKAIAACVPTDVVWQGYGRNLDANDHSSSWSFEGNPLPFVPLLPYAEGKYRQNVDRYNASRELNSNEVPSSTIPIENSPAKFLLLGSDQDEIWASGAMTRSLVARMKAADRSADVHAVVYPRAGHQICTNGTYPARLYAEDTGDRTLKDPTEEGAAAADAWFRRIAFLHDTIGR